MTARRTVFAIPGDITQRTGGYGYDRRILAELGPTIGMEHLPLSGGFPDPSAADLDAAAASFAALGDRTVVLVDGLAYALLADVVRRERERLAFVALCHHPLALETGLDPETAARLKRQETEALALARAVIVTSPPTADLLVQAFGVPRPAITVAVPGTDPRPASPCAGSPPVLVTLATLTKRKGHDVLVDALARLTDLAWRADFVGGTHFDPDWTAEIEARIARAGLGERVRLSGPVDDTAGVLGAADLFVLPSRYEGYGMAFAEAMAHGLPIVAARAGAVPDVVPETAGILVPPDDPDALAAAIRSMLHDRALIERYREGSRAAGAALPGWGDAAGIIRGVLEGIRR
ncbi:glycosyltransferase family 4 protein [Chthonobacter albigriseus]|uniref:glycosyltransferase family 4 protein n=1 Tax=Chthonobacter albigriseus TaxID=1683161 RepID=UPI0015EFD8E3|nr:glycosyltransferase family 4 protein [Chthonobacter albigriseus]